MQTVTVRGVLRTCECTGVKKFAGYVAEGVVVPEPLIETPVLVLDPEDNTGNRWILAFPDAVGVLSEGDLTTLASEEPHRQAVSKLTDAELTALGLTR